MRTLLLSLTLLWLLFSVACTGQASPGDEQATGAPEDAAPTGAVVIDGETIEPTPATPEAAAATSASAPSSEPAGIEPPRIEVPTLEIPTIDAPAIAAGELPEPDLAAGALPQPGSILGDTPPITAAIVDQQDAGLALAGNIFEPAGETPTPPQVNIELLFDSSGSMAELIGNEPRIEVARRSMKQVIAALPTDDANLNVGFRVFGQRGGPSEAQKPESCAGTDLLVPVSGVDAVTLNQQVDNWVPNGWTPIDLALQDAGRDLTEGENVHNVIVLITDGEETCGGDPAATAATLAQSGIAVRVDVVGFALGSASAQSLWQIARNGGGQYVSAEDGDALAEALLATIDNALQRSSLRLAAYGPDGQLTENMRLHTIVSSAGETVVSALEMSTNPLSDGDVTFQLPPDTYTITAELYEGAFREGFVGRDDLITVTAVLEPGRETVAVVGYGEVELVNNGTPQRTPCRLNLEVEADGQWQVVYRAILTCVQTLSFDAPVPLVAGTYRLVDTAMEDQVLLDDIVIEPGRTVIVELSLNEN